MMNQYTDYNTNSKFSGGMPNVQNPNPDPYLFNTPWRETEDYLNLENQMSEYQFGRDQLGYDERYSRNDLNPVELKKYEGFNKSMELLKAKQKKQAAYYKFNQDYLRRTRGQDPLAATGPYSDSNSFGKKKIPYQTQADPYFLEKKIKASKTGNYDILNQNNSDYFKF